MKKNFFNFNVLVFSLLAAVAGFHCVPIPGVAFDPNPFVVCGDSICDTSETALSCATDCGTSYNTGNPYCGDGSCNNGEDSISCAADCGTTGLLSPSLSSVTMVEAGGTALVNLTAVDTDGLYFIMVDIQDTNGTSYGSSFQFDNALPIISTSYSVSILHTAPAGTTLYPAIGICDLSINCSTYYYQTTVDPVNYTLNSIDTNNLDVATQIAIPLVNASNTVLCGDGICSSPETSATCLADCAGFDFPPSMTSITYSGLPSGVNGGYAAGDVITVTMTLTDDIAIDTVNTTVDLVDSASTSLSLAGSSALISLGGNSYSTTLTVGTVPASIVAPVYLYVVVSDTALNYVYYMYYSTFSLTNYTVFDWNTFSFSDSGILLAEVPVEIIDVCGDTICGATENSTSCVTDCPLPEVCGNGVCGVTETITSCPGDCGVAVGLPASYTFESLTSLPAGLNFTGTTGWLLDTVNGGGAGSAASLASGNIADSESTCMAIYTNHVSMGSVSFDYKTDSEYTWDYLNFYINGIWQAGWSGATPWTSSGIFTLNAGANYIEWCYSKDSIFSSGLDMVWIDNININ